MFSVVQLRRCGYDGLVKNFVSVKNVTIQNNSSYTVEMRCWNFPDWVIDADGQQLVLLNMATRLFLIWSA